MAYGCKSKSHGSGLLRLEITLGGVDEKNEKLVLGVKKSGAGNVTKSFGHHLVILSKIDCVDLTKFCVVAKKSEMNKRNNILVKLGNGDLGFVENFFHTLEPNRNYLFFLFARFAFAYPDAGLMK